MAPAYQQAAKFLEPDVRLGKVNADEEPRLVSRFGISNIPTLIVFRGGVELARQSGVMETQDIVIVVVDRESTISLVRLKRAIPFPDKTFKRNGTGNAGDDNLLFVYRDHVQSVS